MSKSNVYQHIAENVTQLSKSHKKVAQYILENTNMVPFFKVATLAKKSGVSEATVVRFASSLGYSGYPEMKQYMQNSVQIQLTTTERMKMSSHVYEDEEKVVYDIFQEDIENIKSTMEKLDIDAFHRAAGLLLNAKKIYISANRSAASLGIFLQYYLNIILANTEMLVSVETISEQLYSLDKNDVVIGISFARYSSSTLNTIAFSKSKGANTIVITDNFLSPLIRHADIALTASSDMPSFIDSFTAPLSIINALLVYLGKRHLSVVEDRLNKMEEIWDKFGTFYNRNKLE